MKAKSPLDRLPPTLRRRPALLLVGLLLLIGLGYLGFGRRGQKQAATAYFEVRRGDFTVSVVEGGTLTAVNEVSIRNEVEGTARIIYIVPEGSYVKKDQLLVELDSSQAQDQVNQQQINVEKAQFALVQAEQTLEIQKSVVDSEIRTAELAVKFAQMDLDKFDQGQSLVNLLEASNNVSKTEAQLEVAQNTFEWSLKLATNGYETKRTVDSDRLSVMNNQYQLLIASNNVWMLQQFDIPKQREQLASNLEEAKKTLERTKASGTRKIAQYEADLLTQSNTLSLTIKKLERDKKNLDAARKLAPQDGFVVYPVSDSHFSSESLIEEGAMIRNRQELIKLPDTSKMKVTVKVHESHVNMIRPGLPAYIVLDSMPEQRFAGHVDKVGILPDTQSRWGNPNLKVYNTDVFVTDPLPNIKPGVSARAEIIVTNIANALSVPIQAVTTLGGRQVVYALKGGKTMPVPVEVGMFNTKFIEITSGLKDGDRVLLSPPFDTEEKDLEGTVLTSAEKSKVVVTNLPSAAPTGQGAQPGSPPDANGQRPPGMAATAPDGAPPGLAPGMTPGGLPGTAREGGGRRGGMNPEEMLKQFDKDGDGELNDEERQAMRDQMRQRGGSRTNLPAFDREAIMKQFDKDGDGDLNDEERQTMREEMQRRFGGQGPGQGRPRGQGDGQNQNRREDGDSRQSLPPPQ